ncbi:MAG: phosphopyruvate hydratase, partial [Nanoarchaeota archaeon]|nr:phosphopyruvate hydratase [Nanoarchaeota archaeon]
DSRFFAEIPSGKSRGKREVAVFAFPRAKKSLGLIFRKFEGRDFSSIQALDRALIEFDGTANKSRLGGNVMLGVSIAFTRVLAAERGKEAWQILREEFFPKETRNTLPLIFSNLINGGAHAENNLDIQEYMVVARPGVSVSGSVKKLIGLYRELGALLRKKTGHVSLGDEGGYSLNFRNNFEPIAILEKLILKQGLTRQFRLALDVAANSFYEKKTYRFGGRRISGGELLREYGRYVQRSKLLFSIEDPFAEEDLPGFVLLRSALPNCWIVGDDLTATNPRLVEKAAHGELANAVIIKPNQIGTVSEACEALSVASREGMKTIVSHRSGETGDNFIIHLARAASADGVKIGAPARERLSKFNELIRLYG